MKKNYKLIAVFVLLFVVSTQSGFSQSLKDRYFSNLGYSILDFFRGPLHVPTSTGNSPESNFFLGLITYSYTPRLNLLEMSKNSSVSANLPIAASLGIGDFGGSATYFALSVPLTLNLNLGNIATYNSDKNKGFTVGAGIEYDFLPSGKEAAEYYTNLKSSWIQPVANIGYRYWNKNNKAQELNLKIGQGNTSAKYQESSSSPELTTVNDKTFSFRLSFCRYINY